MPNLISKNFDRFLEIFGLFSILNEEPIKIENFFNLNFVFMLNCFHAVLEFEPIQL